MSAPFPQNTSGAMTYPVQGTFNRLLFKMPLLFWRMGLGSRLGEAMIVLTTWGRKSGRPRATMLSFNQHAGKLYIVSGWGERADWLRNLQADPHVTVQHGGRVYGAIARAVTEADEFRAVEESMFQSGGDAFLRPWLQSLGIAYDLDDLVAKRDRVHLLRLDPAEGKEQAERAYPPPLQADLKWLWGVMAVSFAAGWLAGRISKKK